MSENSIGNYYLVISVFVNNSQNQLPIQNVYSFSIQQYVLDEIKLEIPNYRGVNDLQNGGIISYSNLSFKARSEITLTDVSGQEKKEILNFIN